MVSIDQLHAFDRIFHFIKLIKDFYNFFDNLFVYNKFTGLDITVKIIIKYTNITQIVVCDIGIFTIRYTGDLFFDRRSQFPVGKTFLVNSRFGMVRMKKQRRKKASDTKRQKKLFTKSFV